MKIRTTLTIISMAITMAIIFTGVGPEAFGGNGKTNLSKSDQSELWRQIEEADVSSTGARFLTPGTFVVFRLNRNALKTLLAEMPLEFSETAAEKTVIMEVPLPDGQIQRFRIEESDVLAAHIKADFPAWKTFNGYGVDDPTARARFDWTSKGFHGYILTPRGTVYIEPYQDSDTRNYIVFNKHEYGPVAGGFYCSLDEKLTGVKKKPVENFMFSSFSNGAQLRQYRIAVATTGEWARSTSPSSTDPNTVRTAALAALTTAVNRLDGIYRRELGVALQLVNPSITNEMANIIFDDPATDPYDNMDSGAQLTINHNTLVGRVGTMNFDVGHLFGTGGGGVATSPAVCSPNQKGEGYSARAGFLGDPFVVDYVSHELGHQFGADHTYNNSDPSGACTTRAALAAYEVASGSSIMSYVGICNDRNLQQYVDTGTPAFHIKSLTENITNIQDPNSGGSCGTPLAGTNTIPTVSAGANYVIPRLTPFTLTAAANDPDAAATLLYSWEQYDLAPSASGASGTPAGTYDVDTDGVLRPLFRAYSPSTSPSRTFPSLTFILNNQNAPPLTYTGTHATGLPGAVCETGVTCVTGENLPSVARTMNFRVAVRDNQGGNADAGMTVTVAAGTGPFRISSQNTQVTWAANSSQTITWDVAGTGANGINVANVKISLSTDGGQSFPITLAASTANDGTESITVPNNATTQARIKVEAVGNIFFDINDAAFTINAVAVTPRSRSDFDGDGKTDLSVFRPGEGNWYLNRSTAGFGAVNWGVDGDIITPGDFDGDNKADFAVWRPSDDPNQPDFYLLRSSDLTFTGLSWGITGDLPVTADYDGDGKADFAVWRPSTGDFFVLQSQSGSLRHYNFGVNGDKPLPGDFDGDGKADFAVFRPSTGTWYIARSSDNNLIVTLWGLATDIPVFADYDGDNKDDIAVFRPSDGIWYIRRSSGGTSYIPFGADGDIPVPGDYDGDGKSDQAVYRGGVWYLNNSTSGFSAASFGLMSDIPTPRNYLPQ